MNSWWQDANRIATVALVVSLLSAAATGVQAWYAARQFGQSAIQSGPSLQFDPRLFYEYDNPARSYDMIDLHRKTNLKLQELQPYREVYLGLQIINVGGQETKLLDTRIRFPNGDVMSSLEDGEILCQAYRADRKKCIDESPVSLPTGAVYFVFVPLKARFDRLAAAERGVIEKQIVLHIDATGFPDGLDVGSNLELID
jgi:hypothetical protein